MTPPARGEVWLVDLNPTHGHEQAGRRPALVVSDDLFNRTRAELVIVVPLTSTLRAIPSHVRIRPPEGGVRVESAAVCEAIRSVAKERLVEKWGAVSPSTMGEVEDRLRMLMRL